MGKRQRCHQSNVRQYTVRKYPTLLSQGSVSPDMGDRIVIMVPHGDRLYELIRMAECIPPAPKQRIHLSNKWDVPNI